MKNRIRFPEDSRLTALEKNRLLALMEACPFDILGREEEQTGGVLLDLNARCNDVVLKIGTERRKFGSYSPILIPATEFNFYLIDGKASNVNNVLHFSADHNWRVYLPDKRDDFTTLQANFTFNKKSRNYYIPFLIPGDKIVYLNYR